MIRAIFWTLGLTIMASSCATGWLIGHEAGFEAGAQFAEDTRILFGPIQRVPERRPQIPYCRPLPPTGQLEI